MSIETLKHLGLSDNEIKVYLANLELGQATVQALARKSGVKRTTIYMVIESLQAKGLVSQSKKAKKTVWLAEDPESLVALSEERAQALKKALPELKSIFNIPGAKPKVRFYEGKEGYLMVYESILKDCSKELLVIASYEDFLKHIDTQYENNWTKKRIEKKIFLR